MEPNLDGLERFDDFTPRRLTVGLERLVERFRSKRGVGCLGLEGVRKIRGPDEKEGFCPLWPSDRFPRDLPARALSGWTRGLDGVTLVCLPGLVLEPTLDPEPARLVCVRFGPTLMMLGPPRRLAVEAPPCCSPPLKILGEVPPALPALDGVVREKLERVEVTPRRLDAAVRAPPARIAFTVRDPGTAAEPPLTWTFRPPRTGFRTPFGSPSRNLPAIARVGVTRRSSREPLPKSLSLSTFKPLPRFRGLQRLIVV